MTIVDEILISANKLANEGKKPTVALIKAKLATPAPLPTIIRVLKTWQHDENFIGQTESKSVEKHDTCVTEEETIYCTKDDIDKLQQQLIEKLSVEINALKKDLKEIKNLLKSQ